MPEPVFLTQAIAATGALSWQGLNCTADDPGALSAIALEIEQ